MPAARWQCSSGTAEETTDVQRTSFRAQARTRGTTVLPNIFPDARSGREGVRRRSEARVAHVPVLAFWLNSEGAQMALHVRRKREGAGRLRGSEATPGMAEAGRSGLLRQRILADRLSRRVELVSRAGHFLARDAVSDRAQDAAADVICWRNRRCRGRVRKALRCQLGEERSESLEQG